MHPQGCQGRPGLESTWMLQCTLRAIMFGTRSPRQHCVPNGKQALSLPLSALVLVLRTLYLNTGMHGRNPDSLLLTCC